MGKSKEYKYFCKHCKKDNQGKWPRNWKWKTKRGFDNHRCYKDELKAKQEREEEVKKQLKEREATAKYQVGDTIFYSSYHITKPIYETNHWGRRVKMRYEEERKYFGAAGKITKITLWGYIVDQREVGERDIYESLTVAKETAELRQKRYDEHCKLAQMCR